MLDEEARRRAAAAPVARLATVDEAGRPRVQPCCFALDGSARVVEEGPEWDRAVALLAAKYPQYRDRPPRGPVIVIAVERLSAWAGS